LYWLSIAIQGTALDYVNPSSEWKHWSTCGRGITACDCHRQAVKWDYCVLLWM